MVQNGELVPTTSKPMQRLAGDLPRQSNSGNRVDISKMHLVEEEIFGPALAVATFKDQAKAPEIAHDTPRLKAKPTS